MQQCCDAFVPCLWRRLPPRTTSELRCSVRPSTWSKMLASVLRTLASHLRFAAAACKHLGHRREEAIERPLTTVSWRETLRVYHALILSSVFDIEGPHRRRPPTRHVQAVHASTPPRISRPARPRPAREVVDGASRPEFHREARRTRRRVAHPHVLAPHRVSSYYIT